MSDPKPELKKPEAETYTPKADITWKQRDGSVMVIAPAGVALPMAEAKRLAKAGALDMDTGKPPVAKAE